MAAPAIDTPPGGTFAVGLRTDRHFKYLIVLPAVFILLFIGIFPLIYTLVASVQTRSSSAGSTSSESSTWCGRSLRAVPAP